MEFTHSGFINSSGESSSDNDDVSASVLTLYATGSGGSITVKYELTAVGESTFTVGANDETFTAYGVRHARDIVNLMFTDTSATVNPKVDIGYPNPTNNYNFDQDVSVTLAAATANLIGTGANDPNWVLVDFKRVSGSGVLYVDLDNDGQPDRSPTSQVTIFTNGSALATVKLQTRGTTNVIEASVRNSNLALDRNKHVVTYFYQNGEVVKISGDAQVGTPSTQLQHPLVVEVRDAKGTAIPGQEVIFSCVLPAP